MDSKKGKKKKKSLEDKKESFLEEEFDGLNSHEDADPFLSDEDSPFEDRASLDEALGFDAQVLASVVPEEPIILDKFIEDSKDKEGVSSLNEIDELNIARELLDEVGLTFDEFQGVPAIAMSDEGLADKTEENSISENRADSQENEDNSATLAEDELIFHEFDHEPKVTPSIEQHSEMLLFEEGAGEGSEEATMAETESVFKKDWFLGLIAAALALMVVLGISFFNSSEDSKPLEVREEKPDIAAVPIVDLNKKQGERVPLDSTISLTDKTDHSERSSILSDQDISTLSVSDKAQKLTVSDIALKELAQERKKIKTRHSDQALDNIKKTTQATVKNGWAVNLSAYQGKTEAEKVVAGLRKKGVDAEVAVVDVRGIQWFRVRVSGFKSSAEAKSFVAKNKKSLNAKGAWVSKI